MPDDPPLSVLLGADSLLLPRTGVGRMTLEIARQLAQRDDVARFGLLLNGSVESSAWLDGLDRPDTILPPLPPRPGLQRFKRLLADFVPGVDRAYQIKRRLLLRRMIAERTRGIRAASPLPMVYHEPNMITRPFDGPIVATFNDLSWHHDPALHPRERIRWIGRNLRRTIRTASRFVAISAFTRDEMVRELGIGADRVDVAHLAPSPAFRPVSAEAAACVLREHDLVDRGYVLSISTLEPRKNFDRLLSAYLSLPAATRQAAPLVIAGGKGWGTVLARTDAERAAASGQLRLLGHVPDDALATLTARAAVFAYVSLYEGFGLPVVEAMAAGTPVVASATTAVGEVAGEAAIRVDPLDVDAIAAGLRDVLGSPDRAAALAADGLAHAAAFTWARTVDRMARTWRRAANSD